MNECISLVIIRKSIAKYSVTRGKHWLVRAKAEREEIRTRFLSHPYQSLWLEEANRLIDEWDLGL